MDRGRHQQPNGKEDTVFYVLVSALAGTLDYVETETEHRTVQ